MGHLHTASGGTQPNGAPETRKELPPPPSTASDASPTQPQDQRAPNSSSVRRIDLLTLGRRGKRKKEKGEEQKIESNFFRFLWTAMNNLPAL